MTGARWLIPKSIIRWRYWIAKPSAKSEIACGGILIHLAECAIELILRGCTKKFDVQTQPPRRLLAVGTLQLGARMFWIGNDGDTAQIGNNFPQHLQTLAIQFRCHERKARHIAARAREAFGEPRCDGIAAIDVDHRYGQLQAINDIDRGALRNDQIDGLAKQLGGELRNAPDVIITVPVFDFEVAVLNPAKLGEATTERIEKRCETRCLLRGQPADAANPLAHLVH